MIPNAGASIRFQVGHCVPISLIFRKLVTRLKVVGFEPTCPADMQESYPLDDTYTY